MKNLIDEVAVAVYAWEEYYIEPKAKFYLSTEQCLQLVQAACNRERIRVPEVRFLISTAVPSLAHLDTWRLDFALHMKNPVTVLHEVAHLATIDAIRRGENPHGPTFVAKCIDLYHHFLRIPLDYLLSTAARWGVKVGPIQSVHVQNKLENSFDDLEF